MTRVIVNAPAAPGSAAYGSFPYSQAAVASGLVFVAGQGPFDPAPDAIVGDTIQEQTTTGTAEPRGDPACRRSLDGTISIAVIAEA